MTVVRREPAFRIWVEGHPQSMQGSRGRLSEYRERIAKAAQGVVPHATKSRRIDVEIYFQSQGPLRPDVDNIIKPVLDALKGIVYVDDSQVRSVRVAAFPRDEAFGISGWASEEAITRLLAQPPSEFLIDIYEGMWLHEGPA